MSSTEEKNSDEKPKDSMAPVPYKKKTALKKESSKADEDREREIYHKKIVKDQGYMPVMDHFEALRWGIIRSVIWLLVFSAVSMIFYDEIFKFVITPIGHLIDVGKSKNIVVKLMVTRLSDYFVVQFKLSLIAGFLFAIPAIIFEILHFILPAIDKKYRKWSILILVISVALFWGGIYAAWDLMWNKVIEFLVLNWTPPGIPTLEGIAMPEIHLTLGEYLSFFFAFHMTFGIACQMPIICVLLTLAGILNARAYFSQWRLVILITAIISAVVTPPDVMSMVVMMAPLLFLYFISGIFVFIFQKRESLG